MSDRDPLARAYVDVAYALPLDPLGKLEALSAWLAPAKPRPPALEDWAAHHPALDGRK